MTRSVAFIRIAATMVLGGCGVPIDIGVLADTAVSTGTTSTTSSTVSDSAGSSSSSGDPITPATETSTGDPPVPMRSDFAIRFADLPSVGSETGSGSAGGGEATGDPSGGDSDPDALVIFATTGFGTCDEPYGQLPCPAAWTVGFTLPPALQFEGATGLLDFEVNAGFSETFGDDPLDCGFGGGSLNGRFEITAIDDIHVAGRMFDLDLTSAGPEVVFDAIRCGG